MDKRNRQEMLTRKNNKRNGQTRMEKVGYIYRSTASISSMALQAMLSICSLILLLSLISCYDKGVEVVEGGEGIIVSGKSIEGIILGDTKEVVEQKLGEPTAKGWTEGIYRSWRNYVYWAAPHNGLRVDFIENGDGYGPVDVLAVLSPYNGKTKEGIGIGSALTRVRQTYGVPKYTLSQQTQHWIVDFYCFSGRKFEVHYVDSLVTTISIGYFIPLEQDTLSSCR